MNQDDPFADFSDDDKTILKPSPGRRKQTQQFSKPVNPDVISFEQDDVQEKLNFQSENNPLLGCALPILSLVIQLQNSFTHDDVSALRNAVIDEIKSFELQAGHAGYSADQIQTARYILCSLVDEVVLNTPWGGNSVWSTRGMLITFHKEAWGGEKFFQILNSIVSQPGVYLDLLEIFYYCLSLGFQGKYRVQQGGADKLRDIRENLYQIIQRHKGEYDKELSYQWQGIADKRNPLVEYVPYWVLTLVTAAILTVLFLGYLFAINRSSNPALEKIYEIKDNIKTPVAISEHIKTNIPVEEPQRSSVVKLTTLEKIRQLLQPEIQQKKVAVLEDKGKSMIRILVNDFFASGSDRIQHKFWPLLIRIAHALQVVSTPITVLGHTDDVPIFTVRFPSNWALSQARAEAVVKFLEKYLKNEMTAEGRADTQNLVPNDSAVHRAMNRRVEIIF